MNDNNSQHNTEEFTGKYEKSGRIGHWLISRFFAATRNLLAPQLGAGSQVLEIGCGAGYSTASIREWLDDTRLVAAEPEWPLLQLAGARNPGIELLSESVYQLAHRTSRLMQSSCWKCWSIWNHRKMPCQNWPG